MVAYLIVASPSPPPPSKQEVREEPEKIRKWREEQIKRLEEKGKYLLAIKKNKY